MNLLKKSWISCVKMMGWKFMLAEEGTLFGHEWLRFLNLHRKEDKKNLLDSWLPDSSLLKLSLLENGEDLKGENLKQCLDRCVYVMAPHTSSFDYVYGAPYLWSISLNGSILIKKELFVGPIGKLLRSLGAIAVDRKNNVLPRTMVAMFASHKDIAFAITPEGTRSAVDLKKWKLSFCHVAQNADVPIVVTTVDYGRKVIGILDVLKYKKDISPTVIVKDVQKYYSESMAKYPNKFIAADPNIPKFFEYNFKGQ